MSHSVFTETTTAKLRLASQFHVTKVGRSSPGERAQMIASRVTSAGKEGWTRLFEQLFRVDKWSVCRG